MTQQAAPAHEIVTVLPPFDDPERRALLEQCYKVRIDVFHHEQGFPLDTEIDEYDETSTHFLLRLTPSLTPIGTIRTYKKPESNDYKLSRLAVLQEYRQFKFGRALVLALHHWVRTRCPAAQGDVAIISHSQIYVKGFYAKLGYEAEGSEFDEDGAPHQKMVIRIPLST